jgi:amino acid transporter
MVTAVFAFLGTELVGVTVAEAQNPRKTIPRAIRLTFYRILFFYCGSVLMVGMLVPYNSEKLIFAVNKVSTGAAASPFVVAAEVAGVKAASQILNGSILIFVFSAANSDLYISSRTLYALASSGLAPKIFKHTDRRGVPVYALALSVAFSLLAFMNVSNDSKKVFSYFVNLNTIFGLLSWIAILVTHIYWCRARKAQDVTNEMLPYAAPLGVWGSYGALFMCILIALCKNFEVFTDGNWNTASFVTGYLGIPIFLVLIFGYKIVYKTKGYKPEEVDLFSGKDIIDREEEEFLARKAASKAAQANEVKSKGRWFYRHFIAWLL